MLIVFSYPSDTFAYGHIYANLSDQVVRTQSMTAFNFAARIRKFGVFSLSILEIILSPVFFPALGDALRVPLFS